MNGERGRIQAEVRRAGATGNRLHLTADAAEAVADALADAEHWMTLMRAVVAYDEANQSDLPLSLLDQLRAEVARTTDLGGE